MSSTVSEAKQCATCHKVAGIMTCDGCQQTFCGKHVIEHRQQLALQLEYIMQEHDCIQQDVILQREQHPSFQQIDAWEKDSMTKIQAAAEKARADLRQVLQKSDGGLTKTCKAISGKLRAAREEENFSEVDLKRWSQQLNELKSQIQSSVLIEIPPADDSCIYFLRINRESPAIVRERFAEANGTAIIDDDGLRIQHNDTDLRYIYACGQELYSEGRHTVKFRVEKCADASNLFVGICPSNICLKLLMYHLTVIAGWFSNNEVWQHEVQKKSADVSKDIQTGDTFELTLDCENRRIELFRERTTARFTIQINLERSPFPWRVLLALRRKGDCVRIVPSD